jgi:hypothetical protein
VLRRVHKRVRRVRKRVCRVHQVDYMSASVSGMSVCLFYLSFISHLSFFIFLYVCNLSIYIFLISKEGDGVYAGQVRYEGAKVAGVVG